MLMDFVAMIAAGFAAGGVAMALRHFTCGRLPRWLTPAAAGAARIRVIGMGPHQLVTIALALPPKVERGEWPQERLRDEARGFDIGVGQAEDDGEGDGQQRRRDQQERPFCPQELAQGEPRDRHVHRFTR